MKINVVGGGPGGLYASLLLKKKNPDWDVHVYERDPLGATYGWGIVFSDSTLSSLREADYDSHETITDEFIHWDYIDVYYKEVLHRCDGHGFAGIMRPDLLLLLAERCEELGVDLNFESNIEDPEPLAEEADLLIGADGLKSMVRDHYADEFNPTVKEGDAKFVWYGTRYPLDVFTFIFRENQHGLWQIHAYPGPVSTFLVECTEETWRNAGLDEATEEESLNYVEDVFSDHLGGYDLLSNMSLWRNFPKVTNENWSHDNVVLLGDAAHTVNYSIGSGTKMAMEDAIALMEAFDKHGTDVPGALSDYEMARRPVTSVLQKASDRSQYYFENVARYLHMEPFQFTFHHFTRSGRISYDNLRTRDGDFVDRYDRWFARENHPDNPTEEEPAVASPPMFVPYDLGDLRLSNRIVLRGVPRDRATNGTPADEQREDLIRRGASDPGLVLTQRTAVSSRGRITPGTPGMYEEDHRDVWSDAVKAIHERSDAAVGLHLSHAGRRGATRPRRRGLDRPLPPSRDWPLLSASPIPYGEDSQVPEQLSDDNMETVIEQFTSAASRADEAGFDYLQLDMGHGYLLGSFLSPVTNRREDDWGGSLENRMRFPLRVYDAVKNQWPEEKPFGVTIPATDAVENGFELEDAFALAEQLNQRECDLVAVVAGQAVPDDRRDYDLDTLELYSKWVRNEVQVPTLSTATSLSHDDVNTLVANGSADLCDFVWSGPGGA